MRESNPAVLSAATAQEMEQLGRQLAVALAESAGEALVITLAGELGAGKTTLVRGLLAGLGCRDAVRSPTYTLIEAYEINGRALYHLDLYRLVDPLEIEELGVRDLLQDDVVLLIEWAERAHDQLPRTDLIVAIDYLDPAADGGRRVTLNAATAGGMRLLTHLYSVKCQQSDLSS